MKNASELIPSQVSFLFQHFQKITAEKGDESSEMGKEKGRRLFWGRLLAPSHHGKGTSTTSACCFPECGKFHLSPSPVQQSRQWSHKGGSKYTIIPSQQLLLIDCDPCPHWSHIQRMQSGSSKLCQAHMPSLKYQEANRPSYGLVLQLCQFEQIMLCVVWMLNATCRGAKLECLCWSQWNYSRWMLIELWAQFSLWSTDHGAVELEGTPKGHLMNPPALQRIKHSIPLCLWTTRGFMCVTDGTNANPQQKTLSFWNPEKMLAAQIWLICFY